VWGADAPHCILNSAHWYPNLIVTVRGSIEAGSKHHLRESRHKKMRSLPPFEASEQALSEQGQSLQWPGYEPADQLHWFGVTDTNPLGPWWWHSVECARKFSCRPAAHETLLGLRPMNTRASQRLLPQVRPWIDPAQSYGKNQLGVNDVFLNSLRLAWTMSLLADAAVLLRVRAVPKMATADLPMFQLTPRQPTLDLEP
jgi:hypothetical protein